MSYFKRRLSKRLKDPEFRKEWESSELEYVIAANIIKLRQQKEMSQSQLASALNTSQSVISRIENANENISISRLKTIAGVLDVKVVDILQEADQETGQLEPIK